ncbi:MAG: hypothetical protein JSR96_10765 [Proteobacteria bacterium]|nr:hypothetical protein [Pseudomonadota bacterium]
MNWLLLILAGALLCNAVPHIAAGMLGLRFFTPWRPPRGNRMASPVENFLWGSFNLLAGLALASHVLTQPVACSTVALAVGFVAAGTALARTFGKARDRLNNGPSNGE